MSDFSDFDDDDRPRPKSFGPTYYDPAHEPLSQPESRKAMPAKSERPKPVEVPIPTHPTIPGLFPRDSINLLIFTPKIGTFRFLLPQFNNYAVGSPFLELGHPCATQPEQLGMILCSKQIKPMLDKIKSMDLPALTKTAFPIVKWQSSSSSTRRSSHGSGRHYQPDDDSPFPLEPLYDELTKKAGGIEPRFLIVESIYLLLGSRDRISDPVAVGEFTDRLHDFCRTHHCTILGTIPVAKFRAGDEYQVLSHRIYGAVQWGVSVSCIMMIERYNETSTYRQIRIEASAGTNEREMRWANFDDSNRLMLRPEPDGPRSPKKAVLDEFLEDWIYDQQFTRSEALEEIQDRAKIGGTEISRATVDRWLKACVEVDKTLRKDGNGTYWKPRPN